MKKTINDVFDKMQEFYPKLSKSHKKIADFLLKNYENASDMSAIKISRKVMVSEATVVRFAVTMGFDGYPEFRRELKSAVNNRLTTLERIDMAVLEKQNAQEKQNVENTQSEQKDEDEVQKEAQTRNTLMHILTEDSKCLSQTMEVYSQRDFYQSVKKIHRARRIIILGYRTSRVLAEHMGYYLNLILEDVRVANYGIANDFELLMKIGKEDLVIAMSFPRYSKRILDALKYVKKQGATIIVLTDSDTSPICTFADCKLIAKSNVYSFVDSLVAPLSLINALIVAVGLQNVDHTKMTFEKLENLWEENVIYTNLHQNRSEKE